MAIPVVTSDNPFSDSYRFCPRNDVRSASAQRVFDCIEDLVHEFRELKVQETPVREGYLRRKVRTDDVPKVLDEWRQRMLDLEPQLDDTQREIDAIKKKIPAVISQETEKIPKLIDKLLFKQVELEQLQESSKDILLLLESNSFQEALRFFKSHAKIACETLGSSWRQNSTKVVDFERQYEAMVVAIRAQDKALEGLFSRVKHAVTTIQKTTLQMFVQATGELSRKLDRTNAAEREDLQKRLTALQNHCKKEMSEIDVASRSFERELVPQAPDVKVVDLEFCRAAVIRNALYFKPMEFMTYWRYWRSYHLEAQKIASTGLSVVAKGIAKLQEEFRARLKCLCQGKLNHVETKPIVEECDHYKNVLHTLQTRLKEQLEGKEGSVGLYKTEFNPLIPRVIEYADALAELLFDLRRQLVLLSEIARYTEFFEAKRLVYDHLKVLHSPNLSDSQLSLNSAITLFHAFLKLKPLKEQIELPTCELHKTVAGRFHQNTINLLAETLAVHAPRVLQLQDGEQGVFNQIVSRDELRVATDSPLLPLECRAFLAKNISNLLFIVPDGSLDMRVELVLHVLKSHPAYKDRLTASLGDSQFRHIVSEYEEYMQKRHQYRLPPELLDKACSVFKFIVDTLVKREPTLLAYAEAWQVYLEFANEKPDSKPLLELKRLAATMLQSLGIERYFILIIPNEDDKPLQECLQMGDAILSWEPEKQRRLLLRALYAAIWAKDAHEKLAGHKIVCKFLEWQGLAALIAPKKPEFYALIFENTIRKLILRQFDLVGTQELRLFREEGPVQQWERTKTHPIDDDRLNDAAFNIVFCLERFKLSDPIDPEAMPMVKQLCRAMGGFEGFKNWFKWKTAFVLYASRRTDRTDTE